MSQPGAKLGDEVVAVDIHVVLVPSPMGPVPTPLPAPFRGRLVESLSATVCIDGKPAATRGSVALNEPRHVPPGGPFQTPPKNRATVKTASTSVYIDERPVARAGDVVITCNDPADAPQGVILAEGTVFVGG